MELGSIVQNASVVLTALFGAIGLVANTRAPSTGRVTSWGVLSIIGIALSGLCGVASNIYQTEESNRKFDEQQNLIKDLKEEAARSNRALSTQATSFDAGSVLIQMAIPCTQSEFSRVCSQYNEAEISPEYLPDRGLTRFTLEISPFTGNNSGAMVLVEGISDPSSWTLRKLKRDRYSDIIADLEISDLRVTYASDITASVTDMAGQKASISMHPYSNHVYFYSMATRSGKHLFTDVGFNEERVGRSFPLSVDDGGRFFDVEGGPERPAPEPPPF